jgi:hypothetical protein
MRVWRVLDRGPQLRDTDCRGAAFLQDKSLDGDRKPADSGDFLALLALVLRQQGAGEKAGRVGTSDTVTVPQLERGELLDQPILGPLAGVQHQEGKRRRLLDFHDRFGDVGDGALAQGDRLVEQVIVLLDGCDDVGL